MSNQRDLIQAQALAEELRRFAKERDWDQFHSPKNLILALVGEVGELAEIFQWMREDESARAASDPRTSTAVREELADVTLYLVRLADVLGVDLDDAVRRKLKANAEKYPVETARGSSKKYNKPPQP
ncbi:nucleotide pyrophosphohydrolase [Ramlibacter henchirensis]|uniref:Nucleotide pyrophosphohydrolase n=1 Tax=Ramlibacter henchirensis TaxID=204072 RepID=A0A4Z0BQJ7_9BURK|nr:nucleotide pyrophosphohydrolase [Ramlibacter henchirensis]TFZ00670.1 nucleotide pyrophosphohydrolase [Ramlibacter henchirensis]